MKKTYTGLDAIKIVIDKSANVVTGQSQCWEQITNKVGNGICNSPGENQVHTWVDDANPNFPIYAPDDC